jgi:hypothetical protein
MEKYIMDKKFAQDLIRYGTIMVDKEYFTSDGKPVRVRIIHYWNREITKHEFYYYEMINGKFSKLIDISDTALGKYKIGQKIEFMQEGMEPLLHGKIVEVRATGVKVKCKNGGHRYPCFGEIVRIIGED